MNLNDFFSSPQYRAYVANYSEFESDEEANELLKLWDSVDVITKVTNVDTFNMLKSNPNIILELCYGDIGDGHGDMINYILSRQGKLYVISDSSNGTSIAPIKNYAEYKDCVSRDVFWRKIRVKPIKEEDFDSSCFSFYEPEDILEMIYMLIDANGNYDDIDWDEDRYPDIEWMNKSYCEMRDEWGL